MAARPAPSVTGTSRTPSRQHDLVADRRGLGDQHQLLVLRLEAGRDAAAPASRRAGRSRSTSTRPACRGRRSTPAAPAIAASAESADSCDQMMHEVCVPGATQRSTPASASTTAPGSSASALRRICASNAARTASISTGCTSSRRTGRESIPRSVARAGQPAGGGQDGHAYLEGVNTVSACPSPGELMTAASPCRSPGAGGRLPDHRRRILRPRRCHQADAGRPHRPGHPGAGRGRRRDLARQHLPRLPVRRAVEPVLLLLRSEAGLERDIPVPAGAVGLPPAGHQRRTACTGTCASATR